MRLKSNPQAALKFNSSNLKLTNEYYAKYEEMSRVMDAAPQILGLVHEHLQAPLSRVRSRGQDGQVFKYTSENVLRILLSQVLEGESLRGIVLRIDDSQFLRHFVRIDHGPMMDFTTLCKLKNAIPPETWREVNHLLARYAVEQKLINGDKLRLDTTAVEVNIHWPTDSSLLWDTYRTLGRLIDQAREMDADAVGDKRLHRRRTKRLYTKISRQARGSTGRSAAALKPLYKALIGCVEGICLWAAAVESALRRGREAQRYALLDDLKAEAIVQEIHHYLELGGHVVQQARRRVLDGESVPNAEKIFSIFEPHTELIKRGKAGREIEFGHMIQIQQVAEKFITDFTVFEKKPVEYTLLDSVLRSHRELFGDYPDQLAADKGYYENMAALERLEHKVELVSIAKKGKRTVEEAKRESDPVFRHAQRFRAGVEGTISFLKRVLRLHRCFNKGWEHYAATVGITVFAHNLLILARC